MWRGYDEEDFPSSSEGPTLPPAQPVSSPSDSGLQIRAAMKEKLELLAQKLLSAADDREPQRFLRMKQNLHELAVDCLEDLKRDEVLRADMQSELDAARVELANRRQASASLKNMLESQIQGLANELELFRQLPVPSLVPIVKESNRLI